MPRAPGGGSRSGPNDMGRSCFFKSVRERDKERRIQGRTDLLESHDNVVLVLVEHDDGRVHFGELADAVSAPYDISCQPYHLSSK
jgi:hypothetical protein